MEIRVAAEKSQFYGVPHLYRAYRLYKFHPANGGFPRCHSKKPVTAKGGRIALLIKATILVGRDATSEQRDGC